MGLETEALWRRRGARLAIAGALVWLALFAVAPPGLLIVDEVVQFSAIAALAENGRLTVENGSALPGSEDLRLLFLREGPHGLAAQYPAGQQVLSAPFYAIGGIRGIFALNLLAAFASLALIFAIARRLADRQVATLTVILLFGFTFLADYAVAAVWPHALALACALAGVWCALRASEAAQVRAATALAGGLALGIGMTVRLDVALVIPGLAAWMLLHARRPYVHGLLAGAGAVPPILLLALANRHKFGTLNPLSYGTDVGGGAELSRYAGILGVLLAAGVALLLWRHVPRSRAALGALAVAAVAAAIALVPEIRGALRSLGEGAWLLLVDMTAHPEAGIRPGVERQPDGTVTFWDVHKKALLQSMPWLGLCLLCLHPRAWRGSGAGILLCLFVSVVAILPFALQAWHGGYSSNMRYLTYVLPFVSLLAALGLGRVLLADGPPPGRPDLLIAIATTAGLAAFVALGPPSAEGIVAHRAPPVLGGVLAVLCAATLAAPRLSRLARAVAVAALAWGAYSTYAVDVPRNLGGRAFSADVARAYATAPVDRALYYDQVPNAFAPIFLDRDKAGAATGPPEPLIDPALVATALAQDYAIVTRQAFLQEELERLLDARGIPFVTESVPGRHPLTITRARAENG